MTARLEAKPVVLAWQDRATAPPRARWEQLEACGWLPAGALRVVIQIGQTCRSPLATETARTLVAFLRERLPATTVEVIDPAARPGEWGEVPVRDLRGEDPICVSGVAADRGLTVPRFWFESFFLITVAAAHPDPAARLASVLDAQAEPLHRLGNRHTSETLLFEAHRLAASDLSIACGHTRWNDTASGCWWVVSPSDVAVEQVLADAAGIDPDSLPRLRAIARHEVLTALPQVSGSLPRIEGYAAPGWQATLCSVGEGARGLGYGMVHDARVARRNLGKIPHAIRRRLAARAPGSGA